MSRPFYQSELLGEDPIFLLTVDFAGRSFRFSTRPVEITDADGRVLAYNGGLSAQNWEASTDLFDTEADIKSASFDIVFPVDVAHLVAQGHDLGAATGDFALWIAGAAYENRRVLIEGRVTAPEIGAEGEPISFSLESNPWEDTALTIAASDQVRSNFSDADASADGEYIPTVFGRPGYFQSYAGNFVGTSGSPALVIAAAAPPLADTLVLTNHPVEATTVSIYSTNDESASTFDIISLPTGSSGAYTYVSLVAETNSFRTIGEFYARWTTGNALVDPSTGRAVEGAGDLLRYMLRLSSLNVDAGSVEAAVPYLNRFKVAGYINDAVSPWRWLQDNLLPLVPVSMFVDGPSLKALVWRWDARKQDAVELITQGPGVSRVGRLRYTTSAVDVINDFSLEYAKRVRTGQYKKIAILTAAPPEINTAYATNLHVQTSLNRYGKRSKTLTTDIVYDQETAHLILQWQSIAYGYTRREVTYTVPQSYGWLSPGDVVLLTDDELSLTEQMCFVRGLEWGGPSLTLTLLILENPPRDARPAA